MRKVTTINLNHNAFQIDEDGFEALRSYLDTAARALAGNPDREEILSDLEQAIADKCRLTLGPHKNVVSAVEIEQILAEMGPVASGMEESAASTGAAPQSGNASPGAATGTSRFGARRLYRIIDGSMLAGICQGLAAYAGIDVSLVRLAVVLITVFTVFFPCILVYIVLAFLLPAADTAEQKAAAHGQPFRAQDVVDRVKKKHEAFRAERREKRRMNRSANWWSPRSAEVPAPGYAARVAGGVLLPLLTVLSAVWFAVMGCAALVVWRGWYQTGLDRWPPGTWDFHGDLPRWVAMAAIVAVYALFAIPIGAGRRASLYYANGGRLHGWADAWSGLLWIAIVAVLALVAWSLLPQWQELLRHNLHGSRAVIHL